MNMFLARLAQLAPRNSADCPVDSDGASCNVNLPQVAAERATITPVLQIFFGVVGLVAVIMIIIAGLQFIVGQGEPQKIKDARNTIIWSILGLVIALSAEMLIYVLVNTL